PCVSSPIDVPVRTATPRASTSFPYTTLFRSLDALNALRAVLLDLAAAHLRTVLPGYFHWQHAQPITLGHYFASIAQALARDAQRSEEHTSELQSPDHLVCRHLLAKKKTIAFR